MAESGTDTSLIRWSAPECPFAIEYSARVIDDIRLAVTDGMVLLIAFAAIAAGASALRGPPPRESAVKAA